MTASEANIKITNRLRDALELVDMSLLDHLLLSKDELFATVDS